MTKNTASGKDESFMSFASGYTFQSDEAKKNFEVKFGNVSVYVNGLNNSDPVFPIVK
jgi:hypothetical protein